MRTHSLALVIVCSYGKNVEVDYRGSEVTVANFITVLTGAYVAMIKHGH